MKELENLLNKLIEEGRKPFWIELKIKIKIHEWVWFYDDKTIQLEFDCGNMGKYIRLRQIVSAESWLWQFVCDEQLCKLPEYIDAQWHKTVEDDRDNEKDVTHILTEYDYRYRLLESALIPEKELAKFLLDNIKHAKNK